MKNVSLGLCLLLTLSCGDQEEALKSDLKTCEQKKVETEDALKIVESTNASLREDIIKERDAYDKTIAQVCLEGVQKTESVWETATHNVGTKSWGVLSCTPNHTVKMGVIDTKRKITALQIKKADGSFMASRPFSWESEVDKWHVIAPDLLLEIPACVSSSCEVICHHRVVKISKLPSCD